MASLRAIAERRAKAIARLDKAKSELSRLLGVTFNEQPITNRDAEVAQAQQVENTANLIETVIATYAALPKAEEVESGDEPTGLNALGEQACMALIKGGYDTPEKVAAAPDKELEALPHIGKATVKKIRDILAK